MNTTVTVNGTSYRVLSNKGRGVVELAGARGASHALVQNVKSGRWTFLRGGTKAEAVVTLEGIDAPAPRPVAPSADVEALRRELAAAQAKSLRAMDARRALPAGSSRARVTTANARWARAAEARDLIAARLASAEQGVFVSK